MSGPDPRVVYRFSNFALDSAAYELRREGEPVRLARQPMELLLLLALRAGDLVSRDDIAKRLWPQEVFVDVDAGIHTAILKIRHALGDTGRRSLFVETVPGKGYRFCAPVDLLHREDIQPVPERSTEAGSPRLGRRHNLPAELTSFVGRRKELDEVPKVLAASRLSRNRVHSGQAGPGTTSCRPSLAARLISRSSCC